MSKFPSDFDDDTDLPAVNDNLDDIGGEAINALREFSFNVEQNIGLTAAGSMPSISDRLNISLFPDGSVKPSAIASLGLVTLPITDGQISPIAQIVESKLRLDYRTQDLFNYISDLSSKVNENSGWISVTGIKLDPHILGSLYRHSLEDITVDEDSSRFFKNKFRAFRDNSDSYFAINDINDELLKHQWADGSPFETPENIVTYNGSQYPSIYGHTASGIFINTSRFAIIPQTASDLQLLAEFIDSSSIFLYGTRIQNLYTNGISKVSRSASLAIDGYGTPVIPPTLATTHLLNNGNDSSPVDDIDVGDDIIEFTPSTQDSNSNAFDAKFALVKIGDIIRVNYGTVETSFVIKEKKYIQNSGNKKYIVRIAGKNIHYTTQAVARVDKPLANKNKYGVLSVAAANNTSLPSSLIVGSPRGAQTIGIGFDSNKLDQQHHMLYLAIYPTGNPVDGYTILPPIDVTGDRGKSPGSYTLDKVVSNFNDACRQVGYNYRFIAFSFEGEFGIMLADSYGNTGFSILNAVVNDSGFYDQLGTNIAFPNNVIGIFATPPAVAGDALGFGPFGSNFSSPPFMLTYGSAEAAQNPTKIFLPLKRNNYYVNGIEKEKMNLEVGQALDTYGDGYWVGSITAKNIIPGPVPSGRVQTTYRVLLDLSNSNLKIGKTLVVQSLGSGGLVNFGRFIIESITFGCAPNVFTDIVVYDAVHATALSPFPTLAINSSVAIYFNNDSVSFNNESATDFSAISPFKKHFEVYVNQNGETFTHERGRINMSGSTMNINGVNLYTHSELQKLNIIGISSKLRGYQFGSVNKVTLNIANLDSSTGVLDGYLCSYDGILSTHRGPLTTGKIGETIRFYDETNIDFIDVIFPTTPTISNVDNQLIDFQLFPTLSLDDEVMRIATCQMNDVNKIISFVEDKRQFGNTSEKDLSTSALDYIAVPERLLHGNGIIRGFDIVDNTNDIFSQISSQLNLKGGVALVNGKIVYMNNETIFIPIIKEIVFSLSSFPFNINWAVCVNDKQELQAIPLLDPDLFTNADVSPTRIFRAYNPVTGQTYLIDGVTFSDIINIRKDLTILYIVSSDVTTSITPVVTLTVNDARRYVNDADTNLPLKLTSAQAQGNFKNPEAILNWIKFNHNFNSTAIVKGATADTGIINSSFTFDFSSTVIIDGENNAELTFTNPVIFGSNLTLRNLTVNFNNGISFNSNNNNLIFENCEININNNSGVLLNSNKTFIFTNGDNIVFDNCIISINNTVVVSGSVVERGACISLNNVTNFKFTNNSLSVIYAVTPGVAMPGDVFELNNSNGCLIKYSNISGNFNKLVDINKSNDLEISNCLITSTYNPNAGGTPDFYGNPAVSYSTSDLVNSGQGWIFSNINTSLTNILIDNVTFEYNPNTTAASVNRYSIINIVLSSINAKLSNFTVNNCKFNNDKSAGSSEDIRPAISIINVAPFTVVNNQPQPTITNIKISNNVCNRNQSIILTSRTNVPLMEYPGLVAQNCQIVNNICGTIGYWVSSESKYVNIAPNINSFNDKTSGLFISNNICHYITNLDSTGKYFLASKVTFSVTGNQCQYPSGFVTINENKCNWIHVSVAYQNGASLHVTNNKLHAYNPIFMESFNDTSSNTIFKGHECAIFINSNKFDNSSTQSPGEGHISSVIIDGNITNTGYWLDTNSNNVVYRYTGGYIFTQSTAFIINNILKGIDDSADVPAITIAPGSTVNNNQIFRNGKDIWAYVALGNFDVPAYDGTGSFGKITDNFFDSPITGSTGSDKVVNLTSIGSTPTSSTLNAFSWVVERNINQTGYLNLPLTNMLFGFGTSAGNFGYYYNDSTASDFNIGPATDNFAAISPNAQYGSLVLRVRDNNTGKSRLVGWQNSVDKYLPIGTRILEATVGVQCFDSLVKTPSSGGHDSKFVLSLDRYADSTSYVTLSPWSISGATDTTPDSNMTAHIAKSLSGGQINSSTGLLMMHADTTNFFSQDISRSFMIGTGYSTAVSLTIDFASLNSSGTTGACKFLFSPILIKYRW